MRIFRFKISHLKTLRREWRSGQAVITSVLFFISISAVTVAGLASPIVREVKDANRLTVSRQSRALAEGLLEDVVYRYKNGIPVSNVETLSLSDGIHAIATSSAILGGIEVLSGGSSERAVREVRGTLYSGEGAAFFYGVQAGEGGMDLNNTAEIMGSVFSAGPVTGAGNIIRGGVISAGPAGLIDGIHATGTAYAHTITDSIIDGDAHYQVISDTTVGGTSYPGSPDQELGALPITDDQVEDWKNAAAAGGSVACSSGVYNAPSILTIGPKKIPCNLNISGSDTINLTGHLWVTGNITMSNTSVINVDASQTGRTVAIVADNPANRTTSSKIDITNSVIFNGAGDNSYVLLISQNNSAESGGTETAITISNTASGKVLIYAGHGEIDINNSVSIKEVTSYRIEISNSAKVIYETGLASLLFSAGPSGGYTIGGWWDE